MAVALTGLAEEARGNVVTLTHFGRKSGKAYTTKLWFVLLDGEIWIGSLASDRGWVRNLRATGRADLDFGAGPRSVELEWRAEPADVGRYRTAINTKHWLLGPLLQRFVRGTQCAFRVKGVVPEARPAPTPAAPAGVAASAGTGVR